MRDQDQTDIQHLEYEAETTLLVTWLLEGCLGISVALDCYMTNRLLALLTVVTSH